VRFRVDGVACEAAEVPKLQRAEKHDIDVVVDRIKVQPGLQQPGLQQRLAESFEAALRIADGRAMAAEMDSGKEHLFSSKFACPVCSYSLSELEPRLFSFNSPVGACPTCDGLGHTTVFDADRVVAFPSLSLASGAVKGWDRRNAYTFSLLESVARHYRFDIDTAFEALPPSAQDVLLRGSGTQDIEFVYTAEGDGKGGRGKQRSVKRSHPFEGILPNLERRFRETDSARGARRADALPGCAPLPGLRRLAAAARGAQRVPVRPADRRARTDLPRRALHVARLPGLLREVDTARRQGRDCRQGRARDELQEPVGSAVQGSRRDECRSAVGNHHESSHADAAAQPKSTMPRTPTQSSRC